MLNEITCTLS